MSTITFDTFRFVETLEKSGMPREQAAAFSHAQQSSLSEALDSSVATKSDLTAVKSELKSDIVMIKNDISLLDAKFEAKFTLLQWMLGFNLAFTMAVLWKVFA